MRRWLRASTDLCCGKEQGCVIPAGAPYLLIELSEKAKLRRCQKHAGELVDVDQLEAADVRAERAKPAASNFTPIRQLATMAQRDWKQKAAGE